MQYFTSIGEVDLEKFFLLNGKKYKRKNTPVSNGAQKGFNYLAIDVETNQAYFTEKMILVVII